MTDAPPGRLDGVGLVLVPLTPYVHASTPGLLRTRRERHA
jgi:hypothetical protein